VREPDVLQEFQVAVGKRAEEVVERVFAVDLELWMRNDFGDQGAGQRGDRVRERREAQRNELQLGGNAAPRPQAPRELVEDIWNRDLFLAVFAPRICEFCVLQRLADPKEDVSHLTRNLDLLASTRGDELTEERVRAIDANVQTVNCWVNCAQFGDARRKQFGGDRRTRVTAAVDDKGEVVGGTIAGISERESRKGSDAHHPDEVTRGASAASAQGEMRRFPLEVTFRSRRQRKCFFFSAKIRRID